MPLSFIVYVVSPFLFSELLHWLRLFHSFIFLRKSLLFQIPLSQPISPRTKNSPLSSVSRELSLFHLKLIKSNPDESSLKIKKDFITAIPVIFEMLTTSYLSIPPPWKNFNSYAMIPFSSRVKK